MAYPISKEALDLFTTPYRQVADIVFHGTEEDIHITEKDILLGGLSVNRYCVSGDRIEIGSCIAAELSLTLDNSDGRFNDVCFEGAELYVRVGVKKWDAHQWENAVLHYIPLGYFTVDESPRMLEEISLTALDRMVLFDKPVDWSYLTFPMSISDLVSRVCDVCNVILGTDTSLLPNHGYMISTAPSDGEHTYRQLLAWAAEIMGVCGFIDWEGNLILKWYTDTEIALNPKNRFSSDLNESAVEITGVRISTDSETVTAGSEEYAINIEGNALIQSDAESIARNLYSILNGFSYTPFCGTVMPMPNLYPLDIVSFADKNGIEHTTVITDCTYTLNASMVVEGKGETVTKSGYASANPLTKRESAIIANLKRQQNEALNDKVQTSLAFNELICNALGLYITSKVGADGSTVFYLHNKPTLEESETVFTATASGVAWTTTGWNDGSPIWSYGVTAAGDALFRLLSAEGIEVSKVGEDYNIEISPRAFKVYYRDMLVTNIEADEMSIPKAKFTTHAECGKVRMIPHYTGEIQTGTDIIFMD